MGEIIATAKRDIKKGEVVATILSPGTCYYEHGRRDCPRSCIMNDNRFKLMAIVFKHIELTPAQRQRIANLLGEYEDTGKTCIPETRRVIRGNKDGKYTLNNPLGNFGDPNCDYSKNDLHTARG